jgi:RNA polymerase sigma-70 factor (ECF subfamily)
MTLLQRARAGDAEAWRRLLHLYVPLVDYWCRQWGVRGADSDDVQQDVFSAVAAALPTFQRDRAGGTFRGWLRGITRHKLLDYLRRRDHQPRPAGGSDAHHRLQQVAEPPPDLAEEPAHEVNSLYRRALDLVRSEFEDRSWQAFWRTAVDGQPPADVAAELGMSAVAVRKAKSRVLRRLKDEMGDLIA